MLCSDAQNSDISDSRLDTISDEVVSQIEKELMESPYDMVSLVFLLYRIPDTALQKLIVYQRLSKDVMATNLNLLHEWVRDAKVKNNNWKHEFVEALLICQLFGVIKKLGLHVPSLTKYYQPDNLCFAKYINPMKKALYKVCENIDSENLVRLKLTLGTFEIDVSEYESCELILLKLMSQKFITVDKFHCNKKPDTCKYNVDRLLQIIEKLPGLDVLTSEVKELQTKLNNQTLPIASSSPSKDVENNMPISQMKPSDFDKEFELWQEFELDENGFESDNQKRNKDNHATSNNAKQHTMNQMKDSYKIKNKDRIGVCVIINIEDFYLSQSSIHDSNLKKVLDKRHGSSFDKIALKETMSSLKFAVITVDNLDHKKMIETIKDTIKNKVLDTDSIFMMCIMSHGVKGHVFAADCVKVNVDTIQNILDSDEAINLRGIPKVLIIQACQVEEEPQTKLVADSPNTYYHLKKSDFLIYWATAAEYKAYRDVDKGSIFIQILCKIIQDYGKEEHVFDLFTKVNNFVMGYSKRRGISQVPIFAVTLRKKLFLYTPE